MAGGAYYAGVEGGTHYGSYGYVAHADGSVFNASSGGHIDKNGWNNLDTPEGKYTVHSGQYDKGTPGDGQKEHPPEYNLSPIGTSYDTDIPDLRYDGKKPGDPHPGTRTHVFAHMIHGYLSFGSHGCIAVQSRQGVPQFAHDGTITVDESSKSLGEAQQKVNKWLSDHGHQPLSAEQWKKLGTPVKPEGWGLPSRTQKGNKIAAKNYGVLIGPQARIVTYKTAPLEGGGMVTKGTSSITVGWPQHEVSGVTHDTTDGTPIGNGEDSILMVT